MLGIMDMAFYRAKKLIAWVIALGLIGLVGYGAYALITL